MQPLDTIAQQTERPSRLTKWLLALVVVWTFVGVGVLFYFFGNVLNVLSIPIGIIVWCVILVFGLRSPINWMNQKGLPRGLACAIAFVLLIAAAVVVFTLVTSPVFGIGEQFDSLVGGSSSFADGLRGYVNDLYARYPVLFQDPTVESWIDGMLDSLSEWAEGLVSGAAASIITLTAFTVNAIITVGFALVASFWILLELPNLRSELRRLFGESRIDDVDLLHLVFTRTVGGYLKGLVIICGLIAISCSIGYTVVDLPNPIAFGIITGLCNIIPVIGQWIGAALVLIATIFAVGPSKALVAALVAIILQRIVYTVIYPKVMADSVDVHPVLVIVSMMVGYALGSTLAGVMGSLVGMLVSIPLAAVAKALFVYYFEMRTGRHLVAEDGVFFKGTPNVGEEPDPAYNASSPHPAYAHLSKYALHARQEQADAQSDAASDAQAGAAPDEQAGAALDATQPLGDPGSTQPLKAAGEAVPAPAEARSGGQGEPRAS